MVLEPKVIRLKFRSSLLKLLIDQVGSLAVFTSLLPKMLMYLGKFVYLLWHVFFFFFSGSLSKIIINSSLFFYFAR